MNTDWDQVQNFLYDVTKTGKLDTLKVDPLIKSGFDINLWGSSELEEPIVSLVRDYESIFYLVNHNYQITGEDMCNIFLNTQDVRFVNLLVSHLNINATLDLNYKNEPLNVLDIALEATSLFDTKNLDIIKLLIKKGAKMGTPLDKNWKYYKEFYDILSSNGYMFN